MKAILSITFCFLIICKASFGDDQTHLRHFYAQPIRTKLPLTEDYRRARETSHALMKPIALFFIGSDWSNQSKKFIKEILNDPELHEILGNSVIFVKVDFPEINAQSPAELMQNTMLKEKLDIYDFPTVVLLDPKQREITRLGYMQGRGSKYGNHIKQILSDYQKLWHFIEDKQLKTASESKLTELYEIADTLRCEHFREQLLTYGSKHAKGVFFAVEKYNLLASRGELGAPDAKKLRTEIFTKDPKNTSGALLRIAMLEFQYLVSTTKDTSVAIAPLLSYVDNFGNKDPENSWRVYMMLSQYLYDKNEISASLSYAQKALDITSSGHHEEILKMIHFIEMHQGVSNSSFQ